MYVCVYLFPDVPCMKSVYRDTKQRRRSTSGHLGTKRTSRPGDKPLTNRLSTGDFVPAFGLHRISLVRASGETFKRCVHNALEGSRDARLLGGLFCRRPVLTDPAPLPCRALRPDPSVVCSGLGFDWCVYLYLYTYIYIYIYSQMGSALMDSLRIWLRTFGVFPLTYFCIFPKVPGRTFFCNLSKCVTLLQWPHEC